MAQRFSDYERRPRSFYPTPAWCTEALIPHLPPERFHVWEPACGDGSMAKVFMAQPERFPSVTVSDIEPQKEFPAMRADFLAGGPGLGNFPMRQIKRTHRTAIVTNPPYGLGGREAVAFIRRALDLTLWDRGCVAMLLKADFDSGSSAERRALFAECSAWSKKIVLLERIMWFESETGNASSENHCWYLWCHQHTGPSTIAYADGPKSAARAAKRKGKEHVV